MVLPVQVIIFTRNNWIKSLCPPFSLQSVTGSATNHGCPVEDSPCLRSTCAGRRPCSMDSSPTVLASGLELFMCGENICENICENVCSVINSPIQCCCHCCCFCVANVAVPPIPSPPSRHFPPGSAVVWCLEWCPCWAPWFCWSGLFSRPSLRWPPTTQVQEDSRLCRWW